MGSGMYILLFLWFIEMILFRETRFAANSCLDRSVRCCSFIHFTYLPHTPYHVSTTKTDVYHFLLHHTNTDSPLFFSPCTSATHPAGALSSSFWNSTGESYNAYSQKHSNTIQWHGGYLIHFRNWNRQHVLFSLRFLRKFLEFFNIMMLSPSPAFHNFPDYAKWSK